MNDGLIRDWHRPELSAQLGYAAAELNRMAEKREDAAFFENEAVSAQAMSLALVGEIPVLRGEDPLFSLAEADALGPVVQRVYLGRADGRPLFATLLEAASRGTLESREDLALIDLRTLALQGTASRADVGRFGVAKSLLGWHQRHRFCSYCGSLTEVVSGGWKRVCPSCKTQHFPRVDPVAIMLVTDGDRCLLGRQPRFAPGRYSCLAGFIEPGETIEDAVRREVMEEASIRVGRVTFMAAQPWPFPSSLMIGCRGEALSRAITIDPAELEEARWFPRDEVRAMLSRTHADGFGVPPPNAIAHHLLKTFVAEG